MINSGEDDRLMAAEIQVWAVLAEIEMQGMLAQNRKRESEGHAQAYGEESFQYLRDDLASRMDRLNLH